MATVTIPFAIVGIILYRWAARRRSKGWMIAGGVIGGAASLVSLGVAAVAVAFHYYWQVPPSRDPTPAEVYMLALGSGAGPEVTQIHGDIAIGTDSYQQLLRFHAPPETIAAIVRGRFALQGADDCRQRSRQVHGRPPPWWDPSPVSNAECWVAEPFGQLYDWDAAWILYDRSTGHAHFHYLALRHPS